MTLPLRSLILRRLAAVALALMACTVAVAADLNDGSATKPLRVMLIPADGGTEDGTKADFAPLFRALGASSGLAFDLKVGQSYSAVVEAMASGHAEVAFFGPVSYLAAHQRGGAELLAVAVEKGHSIYYSGIFARADSGIASLADLKGRSLALGDVNSTSSFAYPVAMLIAGGIDPINGLGKLIIAGSHANSLAALNEGRVDACAASFDSFEKAVKQGTIDASKLKVVAKSEPIPYPPLAMHPGLPAATKARLREYLANVHQAAGITPDMIRGYGGKKVDRYDTTVAEQVMADVGVKLAAVTEELKAAILTKAGNAK